MQRPWASRDQVSSKCDERRCIFISASGVRRFSQDNKAQRRSLAAVANDYYPIKYLTGSQRTVCGKEGGTKQWHLISMDTNRRDGGWWREGVSPSATVRSIAVALLEPPRPVLCHIPRTPSAPCLHLPPWVQTIAAKLLSFRDPYHQQQLFSCLLKTQNQKLIEQG